jgi:hypothetical protein
MRTTLLNLTLFLSTSCAPALDGGGDRAASGSTDHGSSASSTSISEAGSPAALQDSAPGDGPSTEAGPNDATAGAGPDSAGVEAGADAAPESGCVRHRPFTFGDIDGDGLGDIALSGPYFSGGIALALSQGDGTFKFAWGNVPSFASYIVAGVRLLGGDVNGDGKMDLMATGGPGWTSIPVAISAGSGLFALSETPLPDFATLATSLHTTALSGAFGGGSTWDIGLVNGWGSDAGLGDTVPFFAYGLRDDGGTFVTAAAQSPELADAVPVGVRDVSGDFDGDTRSDIAVLGTADDTIFVAYGTEAPWGFRPATVQAPGLTAALSPDGGAVPFSVVAGDFDGDGRDDLMFAAGAAWDHFVVVYSRPGSWVVKEPRDFDLFNLVVNLATQFTSPTTQLLSLDANGDGCADLALVSGDANWLSIPVAFSNGDNTFNVVNNGSSDGMVFQAWASEQRAVAVSRDQARWPSP